MQTSRQIEHVHAKERLLGELPLFGTLSRSALRGLARASTLRSCPKGSVVARRGEPCRGLSFILSGRCKARRELPGARQLRTTLLGGGDLFGEREWLTGDPFRATIEVSTDAEILTIPTLELGNVVRTNPALLHRLVPGLIAAGLELEQASAGLATAAAGRIATILFVEDGEQLDSVESVTRRIASRTAAATRAGTLLLNLRRDGAPQAADWIKGLPAAANTDAALPPGAGFKATSGEEFDELALAMRDAGQAACIGLLLSQLNTHYPFIVVHADGLLPVACTVELLVQSDLAVVYFGEDDASLLKARLLINEARDSASPKVLRLCPVVTANSRRIDSQLVDLSGRINAPVWGILRLSNPAALDHHIRYVAHTIGRCRTGLALSSGAAKGLAHIGVIQVLEENGIEIDVVAGTSMGAYVGACWCFGHNGGQLQQLAGQVSDRWGVFKLTDPQFPPRRGFIAGKKAKARIMETIGDATFSDLERPLRVVATELDTLRSRVIDSGHLATAVHASMAMPGICVPVGVDGVQMTDGAVSNPLPVDVLERMGIERIIAVSTQPTLDDIDACRLSTGIEKPPTGWRRILGAINRQINYFARGNVLDTLMRGLQGSQLRLVEAAARRADVFIQVYPCDSRWYQFDESAKYIAAGRAAAIARLGEIRQLQGHPATTPSSREMP